MASRTHLRPCYTRALRVGTKPSRLAWPRPRKSQLAYLLMAVEVVIILILISDSPARTCSCSPARCAPRRMARWRSAGRLQRTGHKTDTVTSRSALFQKKGRVTWRNRGEVILRALFHFQTTKTTLNLQRGNNESLKELCQRRFLFFALRWLCLPHGWLGRPHKELPSSVRRQCAAHTSFEVSRADGSIGPATTA